MPARAPTRGALACLLAAAALAPAGAQSTQLTMDCCHVLNELYTYLAVVDSGRYSCSPPDTHCPSVKLVQLFMNHTRATVNGATVHAEGGNLIFSVPTDGLGKLFVFGFFGRCASRADSSEMELWLSYDTKHNKIVFENSSCDFNKNVYTVLVLASVVLLMFFVAVQVVKNEEWAHTIKGLEAQITQLQKQREAAFTQQHGAVFRGQRAFDFNRTVHS